MCAPPTPAPPADATKARNLRLAYAFTLAAGAARGVWSYAVLSGYLFVLTDSNTKVGLAEGAQGIAQCAFGLLAGWAADRFRRQTVCRVAAILGVVASLGLILAVATDDVSARARFNYVTVGLSAFGAYQGCWSTALETLFADSTTKGADRSEATARKFGLTLLATTAGPLLALILFFCLGDTWSLPALKTVAVVGLALCAPPALLLLGLRDVVSEACDDEATEQGDENIARWILLADLVSGFGSGMTVKFIPLFFKNRAGFSPVAANALSIGAALFMVGAAKCCERWSQRAGRARVCAGCMVLASLGLVGLAWADADSLVGVLHDEGPHLTSTLQRASAVALYLLTCAQHACRPLKKAALNDHVPYHARGRWNALDGVTRFGWSGSAVLGGYLVDRGGYGLTFVVTALTQLAAAAVWWRLVGRVDPVAPPVAGDLAAPLLEEAAPRARSASFVVDDYSEMPRG